MEKFSVEYTVRFVTEVECDPNNIEDATNDLEIPHEDGTEYVDGTFEVYQILNSEGKRVT